MISFLNYEKEMSRNILSFRKFLLVVFVCLLGNVAFAQFSADKVYTITNRNDANAYMQDNSSGRVIVGTNFNGYSYWKIIPTGESNCYYVQSAVTGKYMQSTTENSQVNMDNDPVEICIMDCSAGEGAGMYGLASTNQDTYDFTSGTIGCNWNADGYVQGFAAVSGTNHRSFWKIVEVEMPVRVADTPTDWTAPPAPGEVPTTIPADKIVYIYNIEADAIFSRGMNWLTMSIADRPENGDNAEPANRQKMKVQQNGSNIKIKVNDHGDNTNFGQANNSDPGQMWTDLSNAGNRVIFTPAASENYPNAFTLTNVQHSKMVDVLWGRGGKLTLWNGKGYYDWAFLTADAFTSGRLSRFKARKAIWELYKALEKVGALDEVATPLATAKAVYTNSDATVDELRAAFRTLFLATANKIEDPIDVSYAFTHPDISGDKSATGWSYTDFTISAGECEKKHATFTSSQTQTDMPNGLYDVTFTGIFRQDDGQSQANPQLIVNETAVDFPNMNDLVGQWSVGGTPNADWVNSGSAESAESAKCPNQMWSAADAQALDAASATVEGVKVGNNTLSITFKVTGANQWFNFQRVFIIYKGGVNLSTYKTLKSKIKEAEGWVTDNTGTLDQRYLDAVTSVITSHNERNGNSTVDALNGAIKEIASMRGASQKINALRMPDVYTGSAPAGGKVYLYNIGTGMFLGSGSDWNTHAAVDQVGIEIELIEDNGNFKMKTGLGSGWLNYGGYVDTSHEDVWHFLPVEGKTNVYNISSNGNDGCLLGYDPDGGTDGKKYWNTIAIDRTGVNDTWNQWKIVTASERASLLASASVGNPVDVSYLITNPSLIRQIGYDAYAKTASGGNGGARVSTVINGDDRRAADFGYEFWDTNSFSFTQTLTDLPEGIYMVSVQAFYRDGDGNNQATQVNNRNVLGRLAYLEANGNQTLLPNIASVFNLAQGMESGDMKTCNNGEFPNYPNSALEYFQRGAYVTTVVTKVGANGELTFGVKKDSRTTGDWVVLDNFRLTYLGNDEDIDYMPLPVKTGFDVDVVAENRPAVNYTVGDSGLDQTGSVLYTMGVREDGGLPNDGEITTINGNKYFVDYSKLNGLKITDNSAHTLTLSDQPNAKALYILGISSNGESTVNVVANYTDGTSSSAATLSMKDWYYGDGPNVALNNIKRIQNRVATNDELVFENHNYYPYDVELNTNPSKKIESVTLTRTSGSGASTILAISMYGKIIKTIPLNYGYATFSAAQAYRIDTEGVSAYKVTEGATANEVNLVELTDGIPANTGVVLYGAGKESVQLTAVDGSTSDVSGNLMKPNVSDYELPSSIVIDATTYNNYTLGYHNDEVKFLRSSGEGTLAAGKAYLQLPATAASRVNIIFFEEGTTDIHSTKDTQRTTSSEMYDLQGRRIGNMKANSQLKKGLYIVRSAEGHLQGKKGQKVVVK